MEWLFACFFVDHHRKTLHERSAESHLPTLAQFFVQERHEGGLLTLCIILQKFFSGLQEERGFGIIKMPSLSEQR